MPARPTATACKLTPVTSVSATFVYQTTDPATNHVTGGANTPVDVAAGAAQSFVFAFKPTGAFAPTDVVIEFKCFEHRGCAGTFGPQYAVAFGIGWSGSRYCGGWR